MVYTPVANEIILLFIVILELVKGVVVSTTVIVLIVLYSDTTSFSLEEVTRVVNVAVLGLWLGALINKVTSPLCL